MGYIIVEDTRNPIAKHRNIHDYCEAHGIVIVRSKLYVGDYSTPCDQSVCIDTKGGLQEVYGNIVHDNIRFRDECTRAKEAGIRLIVLVEQSGVKSLDDVPKWKNPREHFAKQKGLKPPVPSSQLAKAMATMADRYSFEWRFCSKFTTGKDIASILLPNFTDNV